MFQNPTYLWALLGLLIPLAIHLWNRKQGKIKQVGSIRWLIASENRRFNSIRLNEIPLWLLRSALMVLLALFLADLSWQKTANSETKTWLLVEPHLLKNTKIREQVKELLKPNLELHLLSKDFPLVNLSADFSKFQTQPINYWSYLQELNTLAHPPKKVKILISNNLANFSGKKPAIFSELEWIILPQKEKDFFIADAIEIGDSLQIKIGINEENGMQLKSFSVGKQNAIKILQIPDIQLINNQLSFVNSPENKVSIRAIKPTKIKIYYSENFTTDFHYLESALQVVAEYSKIPLSIKNQVITKASQLSPLTPKRGISTKEELIFWLSELPLWGLGGFDNQVIIEFKKDFSKDYFEENPVQKNQFFLTKRLNPILNSKVLTNELPEELVNLIAQDSSVNARIEEFAKIPLSQAQMQVKNQTEIKANEPNNSLIYSSLQFYLWLVLLILLVGERWLSFQKK